MESRQERMEKRQERIERMLERMERNLESVERRLEKIERTQNKIEHHISDLGFDDRSEDYVDSSHDDVVAIGGASGSLSAGYDPRDERVHRRRRQYDPAGTQIPYRPRRHPRPYSTSGPLPHRYPAEVYYTQEPPPPTQTIVVPSYRQDDYEPNNDDIGPTLIVDHQMSEPRDRSRPRRRRYRHYDSEDEQDYRPPRSSRRPPSSASHYSGRASRDDWERDPLEQEIRKESRIRKEYDLGEPVDTWKTVKPNPEPKPDIIRPSTVRDNPGLLDIDDD